MSVLDKMAQAVIEGDEIATPKLVEEALAADMSPGDVLQNGLLKGMTEVGRLFRDGEYYVPEVLIAAEAMKAGTSLLKPHLVSAGIKPDFTAIVGTVKGDLHDIGKNLVVTMLEGAGFEVVDLGVDVPADKIVAACRNQKVDLIAISALLTTTMPMMADVVEHVKAELDSPPPVIIGGAPVTQDYADQIGANGYGRDASSGAELAKELCRKRAS